VLLAPLWEHKCEAFRVFLAVAATKTKSDEGTKAGGQFGRYIPSESRNTAGGDWG
jgi:hypothetical protein